MVCSYSKWMELSDDVIFCLLFFFFFCYLFFFFFFQAEDGIRDYKVTGVQTCALPIWPHIWCEISLQRKENIFIGKAGSLVRFCGLYQACCWLMSA